MNCSALWSGLIAIGGRWVREDPLCRAAGGVHVYSPQKPTGFCRCPDEARKAFSTGGSKMFERTGVQVSQLMDRIVRAAAVEFRQVVWETSF